MRDPGVDACARAVAFERSWLRAQATTVDPVDLDGRLVGEVIVTGTARRVRDHNALVMADGAQVDGTTVAALAERELSARGFDHRRVYCATADDADRWRTGMVARGHEVADTLVMRCTGAPPAHDLPADTEVVEADGGLVERWTRAVVGARTDDMEEVADFVRLTARQHDLGVRFLVGIVDDEPVGAVRLFPGSDIAQIEELSVLAAHRGRGLARALLAMAVQLAGPREMVFLTSDPHDWPTRWYSRLGFSVIGRSTGFSRLPADAGP